MGWPWAAGFVVLGLIAELIDLLAGQFGSKRFGGSSKAAWGALIGGFVGAFFGSLIPIFAAIGSVHQLHFWARSPAPFWVRMQEQKGLEPNLRVTASARCSAAPSASVCQTVHRVRHLDCVRGGRGVFLNYDILAFSSWLFRCRSRQFLVRRQIFQEPRAKS